MKTRFRWVIVSLVAFITLVNYLDRSAVGYATGPITQALHINNAQWGLIGSAFSIGYLVLALIGGRIVDRFGVKRVWSASAVIWSIVTALTAAVSSFASLFLIRVLLGVSEGPAFPAVTRSVSRWLPGQERGKALGVIVGIGVPFSLMIGGPIITQMLGRMGWQATFVVLGLIGLLWVAVWLWLFKDLPGQSRRVNAAELQHIEAGQRAEEKIEHASNVKWGKIFTNGNLWWTAFGYFAWGFMFWGFMFWLPGYLGQQYHLNLYAVGAFTVLPWAVSTVGALVGGTLVDRMFKRSADIRYRFRTMGVALLLAGAALIPIIASPSLGVAITFISLGVGFGMITGPLWWVVSIDAAPDQPAAAAGFVDAAFALSGIVAPAIMGFVSQTTGSFGSGFVVMVVLAVLSGVGLLVFTHRNETVSMAS
ncbi:MAG: MFS transporter [Bacilli bacterium]